MLPLLLGSRFHCCYCCILLLDCVAGERGPPPEVGLPSDWTTHTLGQINGRLLIYLSVGGLGALLNIKLRLFRIRDMRWIARIVFLRLGLLRVYFGSTFGSNHCSDLWGIGPLLKTRLWQGRAVDNLRLVATATPDCICITAIWLVRV